MKAAELYDACFQKDWRTVTRLLDEGVSVDYHQPQTHVSTLYVAVARNAPLKILGRIIDAGGNINGGDAKGFTPLHAGCEYRVPLETVNFLLKHGGDPNKQANDGATAVHVAAQFLVKPSIMSALLRNAGNVNTRKKNGATPLFLALENGSGVALVRILVEYGANLDLTLQLVGGTTETPLSLAKKKCSESVVKFLVEWEGVHKTDFSNKKNKPDSNLSRDKIEIARRLFQYAVTSSSRWTIKETSFNSEEEGILSVRKGDTVTLVHGSPEFGLPFPNEDYCLVQNKEGVLGKVRRTNLMDARA